MNLKDSYEEEPEFVSDLYSYIKDDINYIESYYTGEETTLKTYEEMQMPTRERRPDLTIIPDDNINLGYRELSDRLHIECKMGSEFPISEINKNLSQLVRYKYKLNSESHKKVSKYGDYHVVGTTPGLLRERIGDIDSLGSESESMYQGDLFIRSLWHLGLGLLYKNKDGNIVADLNEREKIIFCESESIANFM